VTWPDGVPIRPVSDDTTGASSDDTTGASEESSDGEAASVGSVSCGCEVGTPPPPALLLLLFANVRLRRSRVSLIRGRGATKGRPDFDIVLAGLPIVRPGMPLMKLSTRTSAVLDATGKRTENAVVAKRSTLDVFTASATAPAVLPTEEGVVYTDAATRIARKEKSP